MQNKRYQVFVSSTYADLKDERRSVIETLLNLDCIPAGMEWFGAIDEAQFEYIKKVIDDCDYYVVIIGGRYGSMTTEGISYTEKEYDYALSKKLRVVAFLHKSPGELPAKHVDDNPEARTKLTAFRAKLEGKRLVEYWENPEQLAGKVATSMSKMIRMHPAVGWVRADQVATSENLAEVNELRKDNERLRREREETMASPIVGAIPDLAGLDEKFVVTGTFTDEYNHVLPWTSVPTWREIIAAIGPHLMSPRTEDNTRHLFATEMFANTTDAVTGRNVAVSDVIFQTVKLQLIALGVLKVNDRRWTLTPAGERQMFEARVVRSELPGESQE
jgi:hypothetical protein